MIGSFEFTVGGTKYRVSRQEIEQALGRVEPEEIDKVFTYVDGRRYPVKQALAAGAGLVRSSFTTQYATRILQKAALKVCENTKMGLVDYAELEGKVFETSKCIWRSTLLNTPGASDSDLVCFKLGFTFEEDREPTRVCRVWSSDVALHTDRKSERNRLHQTIAKWLEGNERDGEVLFPG
jgi:hypothetical protein